MTSKSKPELCVLCKGGGIFFFSLFFLVFFFHMILALAVPRIALLNRRPEDTPPNYRPVLPGTILIPQCLV